MIVLGIDPGTATTGWGVIKQERQILTYLGVGIITTPAKISMPFRLLTIYNDIVTLIKKFQPQAFAVEELFFNTNVKTALSVGQARGVVLLAGQQNDCEIFSYTPLQVKMAVAGYGRAEKRQVQVMVQNTLKLEKIPKPDDAADALAIALTHIFSMKIGGLSKSRL